MHFRVSGFFVNRFRLLRLSALALAWLASPFQEDIHAADAEGRPHVLVYLSDDHSQFDSRVYGETRIPTPNMEKLAADGMRFTHAFVASPSCAPSRAALLTGRVPSRNGAEANHTYPHPGLHSLVSDFKQAGYRVAAFGKVAHGPPDKQAWVGFDRLEPVRDIRKLKPAVARYIEQHSGGQPLCLFVGTSNPHVPWPMNRIAENIASVPLPPHHLDTPETRRTRAAYLEEIRELDELLGELRTLAAKQLGHNVLFVHSSDHGSQWPFGKWNLYDYGIRVPLLAAWPGHIPAGRVSDAMVSWVDLLPTLLDAVGTDVPDGLDGRSFLPVLLGRKDTHRDRIFTTHSGDGTMNIYPIRSVRTAEWKLIHNLRPDLAHTNHSDLHRKVGAGSYWTEWAALAETDPRAQSILDRYFRRPEFELYHVAEDRWEMNNLAEDPSQAKRLAEMKAELRAWQTSVGDQENLFDEPRPLNRPETWHPSFFSTRQP